MADQLPVRNYFSSRSGTYDNHNKWIGRIMYESIWENLKT